MYFSQYACLGIGTHQEAMIYDNKGLHGNAEAKKWKKTHTQPFPLIKAASLWALRMVWGACDKIIKLISARTTAAAKLAHNQRWNFNPGKALLVQLPNLDWRRPTVIATSSIQPSIYQAIICPGIHMPRESGAHVCKFTNRIRGLCIWPMAHTHK